MKKLVLSIFMIALIFSLTSCGKKEEKCPEGMTCNNLDKWIGVEKTLDKDQYDGDVFFVGEDLEVGTYLLTNSKGETQILVYEDKEAYESYRQFNRSKISCTNCIIGNYHSFNQHGDKKYVNLEEGNLAVFYGDRCDFTKLEPISNGVVNEGTYSVPAGISEGLYEISSDVVSGEKKIGVVWVEGISVYLFENSEDYYNFKIENDGTINNPNQKLVDQYVLEEIFLCPDPPYHMTGFSDSKKITLNNGMIVAVSGGSIKIKGE